MGRTSPPARSFAIDQVSRLLALPTDCHRIALSGEGIFGWRSDFECAARRGRARWRQSLSPVTSWWPRHSVLRSEYGSTGPTPLTYAKTGRWLFKPGESRPSWRGVRRQRVSARRSVYVLGAGGCDPKKSSNDRSSRSWPRSFRDCMTVAAFSRYFSNRAS
jgi:hypothetical protein